MTAGRDGDGVRGDGVATDGAIGHLTALQHQCEVSLSVVVGHLECGGRVRGAGRGGTEDVVGQGRMRDAEVRMVGGAESVD